MALAVCDRLGVALQTQAFARPEITCEAACLCADCVKMDACTLVHDAPAAQSTYAHEIAKMFGPSNFSKSFTTDVGS